MKNHIADFIIQSTYEELPVEVRSQAKLCLLDVLGGMIAGFPTASSMVARKFASSFKEPQESTLFGNESKVPCIFAAFSHSTMSSDLDADDGHRGAMGHPGAAIIPASLAVGEMHRISGRTFLEAVAIGYEIGIRMGMIVNRTAKTYFWGSGNWVSFGVTAAVSKILNLGKDECMNALGICESHTPMAPMNWMFSGHYSMTKEAIGWGALTGISAALLAGQGMTANVTFAIDKNVEILDTLGKDWEINKIYFKNHSSCRYTHPAIDSIIQLKSQSNLKENEISRINIGTFRFALGLNSTSPKNIQQAQYSIPFTVGAALVYGQVSPNEISEARLNDERIITSAKKVHLYLDPEIENHFPQQTRAKVEVELKDGTLLKIDSIPIRGDYQYPFTKKEIENKFWSYTRNYLSDENIERLISYCDKIDGVEDITTLITEIQRAINNSSLAK